MFPAARFPPFFLFFEYFPLNFLSLRKKGRAERRFNLPSWPEMSSSPVVCKPDRQAYEVRLAEGSGSSKGQRSGPARVPEGIISFLLKIIIDCF